VRFAKPKSRAFGRMDRIATFAYERDLAVCSTQEQLLALLPSVSEQM